MSRRARLGLGAVVALMLAAPVVAGVLVQRGVRVAHAAAAEWGAIAADSAAGDSAAFATLPDGLARLFAVHTLIGRRAPEELPLYECIQLDGPRAHEVRRRLQLRLPDSSAAVLYAIADAGSGELQRVEFLRRVPREGQRGFIWDHRRDRTTSVWWFEGPAGLSRREERGTLPRGGPVPRAVRGLGRQLFASSCADSSANSPMNPISGSRN